jgi:hypothetical protein
MYKLLFISLGFILFSCTSIKNYENNSDFLLVNEMELNDDFLNLILDSKSEFKERFGFQPYLLTVSLVYDEENNVLILLSPKSNLFASSEEKDFANLKFSGGINIEGTFVLLNKTLLTNLSPFLKIKSKVVRYNINYGNTFDFCDSFYAYKNELFTLKDSYCSGSIFTK